METEVSISSEKISVSENLAENLAENSVESSTTPRRTLDDVKNFLNSEEFELMVHHKKIEIDNNKNYTTDVNSKFESLSSKIFQLGFQHHDIYDEETKDTLVINELNFNCGVDGSPLPELKDGNIHFFLRVTSFYPGPVSGQEAEDKSLFFTRRNSFEFGTKKISKVIVFNNNTTEERFVVAREHILNKISIVSAEYFEKMFTTALEKMNKLIYNVEDFSTCKSNHQDKELSVKRPIYRRNYKNEISDYMTLVTFSCINSTEQFTEGKKKLITDFYSNSLFLNCIGSRYFLNKNESISIPIIFPGVRTEMHIYFEKKSELQTIPQDMNYQEKINKQQFNSSQLSMSIELDDDMFGEIRNYGGLSFDDVYSFLLDCTREFGFY